MKAQERLKLNTKRVLFHFSASVIAVSVKGGHINEKNELIWCWKFSRLFGSVGSIKVEDEKEDSFVPL